jgi:hypothetical protein
MWQRMAAAGADPDQEASGIELCAVHTGSRVRGQRETGPNEATKLSARIVAAKLIGPVSREV